MSGPLPEPSRVDRAYWQSGRDGVLRLQRCDACDHLFFPPGIRCVACGSPDLVWTPVSGTGTIWSWVRFDRQYFPEMPAPYIVVRVTLDEGPMLMTNLVDAGDREPAIGDRVRVVFEPAGDIFLPQMTFGDRP